MNKENKTWERDFIPHVHPPMKNKTKNNCCFAFRDRKLLLLRDKNGPRVPSVQEIESIDADIKQMLYLGELNDVSCFAVDLPASIDDNIKNSEFSGNLVFTGLRELDGNVNKMISWLAGKAVHIIEWDINSKFCGRCGSITKQKDNERAKECQECDLMVFPRISPAIIVLIEKGDRVLLARAPHFKSGHYSIIAGFVEPGESVEEAVAREVKEEVGISIKNIRYFGSQPWPYPDSLMIAFTAEYLKGEIRVDGIEIEEAGWFKKDQIPNVPGKKSISGQLIDHFISKNAL